MACAPTATPKPSWTRRKRKTLRDYQELMRACFRRYYRCAQARPLDDRRVPQQPKRGLERHPGSPACGPASWWPTCAPWTSSRSSYQQVTARQLPSSRTWSSPPTSPPPPSSSRFQSQAGTEDWRLGLRAPTPGPPARAAVQRRPARSRGRAPELPALRPHGGLPHPARRHRAAGRGRVLRRPAAALRRARRHVLPALQAQEYDRLRLQAARRGAVAAVRQRREDGHPLAAAAAGRASRRPTRTSSRTSCASCTRPATRSCPSCATCWKRTSCRTTPAAGTCPTRPTPATWRSCASGRCCASSGTTSKAAAGSSLPQRGGARRLRRCLAPPRLRGHRRRRPPPAGARAAGGRRSADVLR